MAVKNGLRASLMAAMLIGVNLLIGCGSGVEYTGKNAPAKPVTKLKLGMTEEELISALGEPTHRGQFLVYPNDPVKTANKEQVLTWDRKQTGKIQVLMKAGKMHSKVGK